MFNNCRDELTKHKFASDFRPVLLTSLSGAMIGRLKEDPSSEWERLSVCRPVLSLDRKKNEGPSLGWRRKEQKLAEWLLA